MFETIHTDPPLATARDLAAYHAHRERFYSSAALLLAASPDRAVVSVSRRTFDRSAAAVVDAARALTTDRHIAADEFEQLFAGDPPRVDLRCPEPQAPSRLAALEQAALLASGDIPAELRTLAILSDRTAAAIETGDIAEAAALCDVQARFLRQHAGACIRGLAIQLVATGLPYYGELGRALVSQIEEDMRLLAH